MCTFLKYSLIIFSIKTDKMYMLYRFPIRYIILLYDIYHSDGASYKLGDAIYLFVDIIEDCCGWSYNFITLNRFLYYNSSFIVAMVERTYRCNIILHAPLLITYLCYYCLIIWIYVFLHYTSLWTFKSYIQIYIHIYYVCHDNFIVAVVVMDTFV